MTRSGAEKVYKTYDEQVSLLISRGMYVHDSSWAASQLRQINYYRLSGYWYPFRALRADSLGRSDRFFSGTDLRDVIALHDFDARLRSAVFTALSAIELTIRARLGHELGRINPYIHLLPDRLGASARRPGDGTPSLKYARWREQYAAELARSREDFVDHHRRKYGGRLPIWAAIEILDWGKLTHLYGMAPPTARDSVASDLGISAPQLESWLKTLNILRNYSAHHGRVFNRVFALTPKLPKDGSLPELAIAADSKNRAFGQLTIIQYLLKTLGTGDARILPAVFETFPTVPIVPIMHTGAPESWKTAALWS